MERDYKIRRENFVAAILNKDYQLWLSPTYFQKNIFLVIVMSPLKDSKMSKNLTKMTLFRKKND